MTRVAVVRNRMLTLDYFISASSCHLALPQAVVIAVFTWAFLLLQLLLCCCCWIVVLDLAPFYLSSALQKHLRSEASNWSDVSRPRVATLSAAACSEPWASIAADACMHTLSGIDTALEQNIDGPNVMSALLLKIWLCSISMQALMPITAIKNQV